MLLLAFFDPVAGHRKPGVEYVAGPGHDTLGHELAEHLRVANLAHEVFVLERRKPALFDKLTDVEHLGKVHVSPGGVQRIRVVHQL